MTIIHSQAGMKFLDLITYPEITIQNQDFTFITGKSGCGKSTYLKILNRTVLPIGSTPEYLGHSIETYPVLAYRKEVMLVPQEVYLFDGNIRNNFHSYYEARGKEIPSDDQIKEALQLCCIDKGLEEDCSLLSGGERQRVFLAIFLSCQPKVLLLDEPTAALDEKTSIALLTQIKTFSKENDMTVICVCHNASLVEMFSDVTIKLGGSA